MAWHVEAFDTFWWTKITQLNSKDQIDAVMSSNWVFYVDFPQIDYIAFY